MKLQAHTLPTFWVCMLVTFFISSEASEIQESEADSLKFTSTLTLQSALENGLLNHPALTSLSLQVKAAEAHESQAGTFPNPEVGVDLENIFGNKGFSGTKSLEATARLGQPIPMGGKLDKKKRVAVYERRQAELELQAVQEKIKTRIRMAFAEGLFAQSQVLLSEENLRLDSTFLKVTLERWTAGKATALEEEKARLLLTEGLLKRDKSSRALKTALRKLAAEMGYKALDTYSLEGKLDFLDSSPPEVYRKIWEEHPVHGILSQKGQIRAAELDLQKAERIPDFGLNAGLRYSNETNAYGFVFGFSIPLPVWNKNTGGIREAEFLLAKSKKDSVGEVFRWETQFTELISTMNGAREEAQILQGNLIPSCEKSLALAREGYTLGRFSYLEVLEAQKTLFETKSQYLQALMAFHRARIALEGGPDGGASRPIEGTSQQQGGAEND